jgi:hypothetical protein
MDAAKSFGAVREKLSELAPRMVKLYNDINSATGITFVEYVRLYDPSVPTHAADRNSTTGYRNHRTYYTMQYMRRLVQLQNAPRRGRQGVRDSAVDDLARTLATILQIVDDPEKVWSAVQSEFGYSERVFTRLRKRVDNTQPVIKLQIAKPAKVAGVVHMERLQPEETEGEALRQPGRNVVLPAPSEGPRARKRAKAA